VAPEVKPVETARPDVGQRRVQKKAVVPQDRGKAGRERAKKEVEQQLATVTSSLENVLDDVSKSLASTDDGKPAEPRQPRRRKTRGGRGSAQLATVGTPVPGVEAPDAGSSAIGGAQIEIEAGSGGELVSESWVPDGSGGTGTATNQSLRTDQSLLAVVRRYAPGIQFCYDNELKKQAGLGGKLIVSITVAAAGNVSGASVVKDTVGSPELVRCAIAQIEAWRFPTIPEGTVTFQAPFVFTPPE
jgi:TonB family protein